jgi:hypothetical protein
MSVYRVGGNKSSQNIFPSVRPTLDLDFANSKTLDPRITFTRASGGSYVGADGLIKYAGVNEARFDHDPETGESLGLMIEAGGTNLLTRSEEFSLWVSSGRIITLSNSTISPDGATNATKIIETEEFGTHVAVRGVTVSEGTIICGSVFVKAAERTNVSIGFPAGGAGVRFNFTTEELGFPNVPGWGTASVYGVIKYPNGWYRLWMITTATGNGTVDSFRIFTHNGSTTNYTGDGASGIYVWGAQVEANSFPTSYIPTQTSTRTRARDDTEIRGKNFFEFYNQNGGTVYSDITVVNSRFQNLSGNSFDRAYSFTNGNFNVDGIDFTLFKAGTTTGNYTFSSVENGIGLFSTTLGSFLQSPRAKACVSYGIGNLTAYLNNNKAPQAFPTKLITCDRLFLGKPQRFQQTPYIIISRFTYYPKQLPEEQIRILTR